jgi:hypothetical protein
MWNHFNVGIVDGFGRFRKRITACGGVCINDEDNQ